MSLWNKTDTQASKPKYINVGQVVGVRVSELGKAYTTGDTIAFSAAPAGGVTATGDLVLLGGGVVGVKITNPGAGYTKPPTVTIKTSTGSGATLVAAIAPILEDNDKIVFVDLTEAQNPANRLKGIKTPGWTKVSSKLVDGQLRHSAEVLVAMSVSSATSGDAADDLIVADTAFAITTQPVSVKADEGKAAAFTVVVDPSVGVTYQWQVQTAGTGAYSNLTNSGVYTGSATDTLSVSDVTGLNKNRYRVVALNSDATASVTSKGAQLAVTTP